MSEFAIRVEGLSKRYVISEGGPSYLTLRDTITEGLTWPLRMARRMAGNGADDRPGDPAAKTGSGEKKYLWLRDVIVAWGSNRVSGRRQERNLDPTGSVGQRAGCAHARPRCKAVKQERSGPSRYERIARGISSNSRWAHDTWSSKNLH